ncbi:MAG: hypothetical protein ABSE22_10730 [Xanthobacteraceae bacterium]
MSINQIAQTDAWINTNGGSWTDTADAAADWSLGAIPSSVDSVLLGQAGSGAYVVTIPDGGTATAASLTLNTANATLSDQGALTLKGALAVDAGDFQLIDGGTVSGETSITNTGTFEVAEAFTLATPITNTNGTVQVDAGNTLTLDGASISGGTIDLVAGTEAAPSVKEISVPGFDSVAPAVSDNGEFTAFLIATNLPQDTNNINIVGVELYDSANHQLTNVSALVSSQLPNDLHPGENFGSIPSISANGQYVVFEGQYQVENFNNVNGPTAGPYSNTQADIFLYNTQSQTVSLVYSTASDDGNPEISGNGQFIASIITTENYQDNVVVMSDTGTILTQIAGNPNFTTPTGNTFGDAGAVEDPGISSNGQFVSFWSTAAEIAVTQNGVITDFSTGNTAETIAEVYVYNRLNNTLQEVSVSNADVPGNANSGGLSLNGNGSDWPSSISATGTYVVFQSSATNLVPGSGAGDQNGVPSVFNVSASNVYLYDTQTNTIQLVSAGLNGAAANGASYSPEISADGDNVIFESTASNLVAGGSGGQAQTYIYDTQTGTIELVSAAADGLPADSESDYLSSISADGSVVAFGSSADNIVPTDTDGTANIIAVELNQTTSPSTPSGAIDVTANATISDATIDGGTVTVASSVTLTLNDATVSGTTIAVNGTLDFTGPGTLDNVSLTGGQMTVASGQLVALDDVTLNNTTLTVNGGATPSIQIDAGQWLVWAGTVTFGGPDAVVIDDNGHILHTGTLDVTFPMQTFEGSGTDTFNGNVGSGSATIVNDGITFDGYGGFGGSITLINNVAGTIDADVAANPFVLDTSQTITNAGTFEATNAATLLIENGSVTNTGAIQAAAESQVDLSNETIGGGTLTGSGVFEITGSSTITGNAALSDGVVEIESGQTLTFGNATVSGSTIEALTVYSFAKVSDPSAATSDDNFDSQNIVINNAGEVIGNYGDASGNYYGFIYSISSGTYITVSDPLAAQGGSSGNGGTTVTSINDSGEVVGYYNTGNGDPAFAESGGEYTTLSQGAFALGINDSGEIVGVNYVGNNDSEGFLYNSGVYTNLNDGLAGQGGTYSFAINNSGQVLGDYYDANDDVHGFIYNIATQIFTDISDPSAAEAASGGGVSGTHAEGFNDAGQVVGYYVDASGVIHGFLYSAGAYTTLNDPTAVNGTVAEGINNGGEIVGYYFDANGNAQVFTYSNGVYTNVNDPSIDGGGIQDLSINNAGQIVGTYDNGELQVFLANPLIAAATLQIATGDTLTLSGATIIGASITNSGNIDVTGSSAIEGDLTITGGDITIASGVTVRLDDVTLDNVALTVDGGSNVSIQIDAGDTLTWAGASSQGPGAGFSAIVTDNNGHIIHSGTLSLGFSMTTFEGSGTVTENGGNTGVPSTLINEGNTIDGYGQQGSGNPGSFTVTNEAAGTFDADVAGHSYIWDAGGSTITNQGLVEATNGGMFEIESTVQNDTTIVNNAGGNIDAEAGSEVLLSNATINGGTVTIAATGLLLGATPGTAGDSVAEIENATIDNSGTLESEGMFTLNDDTITNGGMIEAVNGGTIFNVSGDASMEASASGTVSVTGPFGSGSNAEAEMFTFSGAGGSLTLAGAVTDTSADAVDAMNSGASGNISITANAAITGAINGVDAIESGSGNITIGGSGNLTGQNGYGVLAEQSATGLGDLLIDGTGNVTGTGSTFDGILAEILNAADASNVTVSQTGGVSGGKTGIQAQTDGTGNETIIAGTGAVITGTADYGIGAYSTGTGNISVTTVTNDTVNSGSSGILAVNNATAVPASADSMITVTANGSIDSGSNLNSAGLAPAGIQAGYGTGSADLNVTGTVLVNNNANIIATAGWGIDAFNYGNGNVTLNDTAQTVTGGQTGIGAYQLSGGTGNVIVTLGPNATVTGTAQFNVGAVSYSGTSLYGIQAYSIGTGSIAVTTAANDSITSASSGISAINTDAAIPASDDSSISVTAYGTIVSGSTNNSAGYAPSGIEVGYNAGTSNHAVTGAVSVFNYANITEAAGFGIDAFNYGNGNIIVDDYAQTVIGAQTGISGYQDGDSSSTGNVTIDVGSVSNTAPIVSGDTGIYAQITGTGTIAITNYGTVTGTTGQGIGLGLAAGDTATIENYGTINGNISLLSGVTVYNNAGATWNASSLANSGSIVDDGILNVTGAITGTGSVTIGSGGLLVLGTNDAGAIAFFGSGGTLKFDQPGNFTGTIEGLATGDTIDLANTGVTSAIISGSTLTVTESNNSTLTYTIAGSLGDNAFTIGGDGHGGSDLTLEPIGYLWGTLEISEPGEHLYGPFNSANTTAEAGIIIFGSTPVASYQAPPGPDTVTEYVALADPFFLPYDSGPLAIDAATSIALPFKNKVIYPNLTGATQEAIAVYETDNGSDPVLNREIITDPSGPNGQLSVTSDPIASQPSQAGTIYNLDLASSGSPMTSYGVAWDIYNAQTDSYSIFLAVFNAANTALITGGYESILSQTGVASPSSEVWEFKDAGGLASSGFPYATVMAQSASGGKEDIAFQAYSTTGTKSDLFLIAPNIATGATNQIINPDATSQTALVFTPNAVTGSGFSVAWNETVTQGASTYDQVEFAIFKPNVTTGALTYVLSPITFQVPDAQNVKVSDYSPDGVTSDEFLAYGDATSTTIVEFNQSGQIIATATELSPTGQVFDGLDVSTHGLVSLTYGSNSSQYTTQVYDFRTTGLDDPTLSTTGTNYISGTQYVDVVTGAAGVDNFYYYVGQNTVGLPNTTGPSDTFDGGNTTNWNLAVFADARSDYSIAPASGSGFKITYTNPADLHSGNLTVDANVQALVFDPSQDPTPTNNVFAVTNGETLVLLHPSSFSDEISGPSTGVLLNASDVIDLYGFDAVDTTATPGSYNGTTTPLTVHDSSDGATVILTLVGNYSTSTWTVTSDNNGGADIVDPPQASTIATAGTLELNSPSGETVTFAGGTGSLILDNPSSFTGQIVGFTGTAPDAAHSDTIDLVGINYDSPNFAESYNSSTGLLSVTDGSNTASFTFDNFNATLDFASDGNGGTLITDPPASSGATSSATSDAATDWGMKFDVDKIELDAGHGAEGQKAALVSLNNGTDTFVFHQDFGGENIASLNPHGEANELAGHSDTHLAQELATLISPDPHAQALFEQIHNDGLSPNGVTPAQVYHVAQAGHLLH